MGKFCMVCGKVSETVNYCCGRRNIHPDLPVVRQWYAENQLYKALGAAKTAAWNALEADPAYPALGTQARYDFAEAYMAPYKALFFRSEHRLTVLHDQVAEALTAMNG